MKFNPFNTVPAGTLLAGNFAAAVFWFRVIGSPCFEGFGDSGVLNGCAADVDVAAGCPEGRGLVAVVVCAVTGVDRMACDCEKARDVVEEALRRASRCMHCRQIMMATCVSERPPREIQCYGLRRADMQAILSMKSKRMVRVSVWVNFWG